MRLMLEKLATSCLDKTVATALLMRPAKPGVLAALGHPDKPAFEIPYFDRHGKPTGFCRWRYLTDTREGFLAGTEAKGLRYVQEKNTIQEVFLPPLVDWVEIQNDPNIPITFTEGELKSACATIYYGPTIGLGGVYSFKSTKRKLPLLPVFYQFKWKARKVIIAYDSDAHTNHHVLAARNELCKELLQLGALPYVATIWPAEDDSKRGLDDVVYQEGPEALKEMLDAAEAYAPAAALHELNSEVAYITDPGLVVVIESGFKMRAYDFTGHAYANRHYYTETFDKDGNPKPQKKKAAPAWLEWQERYQLRRIVYSPGQTKITETAEYNSWRGWGCEPLKGDIGPWNKLMSRLFHGKPDERRWFERWLALPLQRPGSKMYTAAVLWGVKTGTGKSLVGYTMARIYGSNFTKITDAELQSDRNEWAINKQFILGDDVTGHDQRKYADRLKTMISQLEMRIDQKYVPSYTIDDCINYLFTSNHPDAFFLEDYDRRNFIHEILGDPMTKDDVKEYMAWLNNGGGPALFAHLLKLDLGGMEPEDRAMETNARNAMIDDGLSDLGRWVRKLKTDPNLVLKVGDAVLAGDLWSSSELLRLYDPEGRGKATAGGLGKEMRRAGFKLAYAGMPVRTATGQHRLFAVRKEDEWLAIKDAKHLVAHHDTTRQPIVRERKF